jgi:hypothetical protein
MAAFNIWDAGGEWPEHEGPVRRAGGAGACPELHIHHISKLIPHLSIHKTLISLSSLVHCLAHRFLFSSRFSPTRDYDIPTYTVQQNIDRSVSI